MKRLIVILLAGGFVAPVCAFQKTALVERFTNVSCGPCATLNNAWYNATVDNLEEQGYLSHIVHNVNWPSATDPMYLVNAADNMTRCGFYGVNSVPWILVDGVTFVRTGNHTVDQANFTALIMETATSGYAPFQIELSAERFMSDIIDVHVTITRDPADTTLLPEEVTLQVGLEENVVTFAVPPGSNGETVFYDVCRKMIPDAMGLAVTVPAPGESFSATLVYIPSAAVQAAMDFDQARVAAFLQDNTSHEVFQSQKVELTPSDHVHAAFAAANDLGAAPLHVQFEDLSVPSSTTQIVSWAWDLDGDGEIDSTEPEPAWTYVDPGLYTVSLTVSDGIESHTLTREDFIQAIVNDADILVVNGLQFSTYPDEMTAFYAGSAIFGDHEVDIWDLFGPQGFDYRINPDIRQVIELKRQVPDSIWRLYQTVIWVGNNYGGDLDYYSGDQALSYVTEGGNLILATRQGSSFLTTALRDYCGLSYVSGDRTVERLVAQDPSLVDMTAVGAQSLVHTVRLTTSSEAIPIFREVADPTLIGGFRLQKTNHGTFVYVAGRPYRWETTASYQNYDYMLDNWMGDPAAVDDELPLLKLVASQGNPFRGSAEIRFALGQPERLSLKIYDAGGRLVRTLAEGVLAPGSHVVTWDAKNNAGEGVAAGVYLYRLEAKGESQTGRLVLMR